MKACRERWRDSHSWAGPVRRSPCRSWRRRWWRMSHTHNTHEARRRRRGRSACAERARLPRDGPHRTPRAPTATGCLISHYNLRAARFLPLLLPRFVLRIIECIPLAPAAMRGEHRPDNSHVQLRPRAAVAAAANRDVRLAGPRLLLAPPRDERQHSKSSQVEVYISKIH